MTGSFNETGDLIQSPVLTDASIKILHNEDEKDDTNNAIPILDLESVSISPSKNYLSPSSSTLTSSNSSSNMTSSNMTSSNMTSSNMTSSHHSSTLPSSNYKSTLPSSNYKSTLPSSNMTSSHQPSSNTSKNPTSKFPKDISFMFETFNQFGTIDSSKPTYINPFKVRHRKKTSKEQFQILEEEFQKCEKPSLEVRKDLASKLSMTPRSIQVWFQNRRAKSKSSKQHNQLNNQQHQNQHQNQHNNQHNNHQLQNQHHLESRVQECLKVSDSPFLTHFQEAAKQSPPSSSSETLVITQQALVTPLQSQRKRKKPLTNSLPFSLDPVPHENSITNGVIHSPSPNNNEFTPAITYTSPWTLSLANTIPQSFKSPQPDYDSILKMQMEYLRATINGTIDKHGLLSGDDCSTPTPKSSSNDPKKSNKTNSASSTQKKPKLIKSPTLKIAAPDTFQLPPPAAFQGETPKVVGNMPNQTKYSPQDNEHHDKTLKSPLIVNNVLMTPDDFTSFDPRYISPYLSSYPFPSTTFTKNTKPGGSSRKSVEDKPTKIFEYTTLDEQSWLPSLYPKKQEGENIHDSESFIAYTNSTVAVAEGGEGTDSMTMVFESVANQDEDDEDEDQDDHDDGTYDNIIEEGFKKSEKYFDDPFMSESASLTDMNIMLGHEDALSKSLEGQVANGNHYDDPNRPFLVLMSDNLDEMFDE